MHNPGCTLSSVPADYKCTLTRLKVHLSNLDMVVAAVDSYSYIGCTPVAVDTDHLDTLECYHNHPVQQVAVGIAAAAAAAAVDKPLDTASGPVLFQNKVQPQ